MTTKATELPPDLRARVLAAAAAEPAPTRRALVIQSISIVLGAVAVALAVFFYKDGLRLTGRPGMLVVQTAVGAAVIGIVAAWIALARGRSMLGRSRRVLGAALLLVPLALLAWKLAVSAQFSGMTRWHDDRPGFRCLLLSFAVAAAPLAALLFLRRGRDPVHPAEAGAASGLVAGAFAWILVDLWCLVAHIEHLLLGHVLPLLLAMLGGGLVGRLVLSLRVGA